MKNNKEWNFRGKLSEATREKVDFIQGFAQVHGTKMTQPETIDFIVSNFHTSQDGIIKGSDIEKLLKKIKK